MTKSIKLLAVIAAVASSVTAFAQQAPAPSAGLLGQRYAQASFGYFDIKNSPVDAFAAGLGVNLPISASLDVGLSYAHGWIESFSNIDSDVVIGDATFIHVSDTFKTFTTLSLGYDWNDFQERTIWGARAGAEFRLTPRAALALSAGYDDDFKSGNNGLWDGTARANYWATDKVALIGSVTWIEGGDVGFSIGAALRF